MYKNMIDMFKENEGKGGIGAFNIHSLEVVPAMIRAAEEMNAPIILQTSTGTVEYIGYKQMVAVVRSIADDSPINVALHMDHCKSFEALAKAIDAGFTSVMYDGSALPLEENIANTQKVVAFAHNHSPKISVEGEIGAIGGSEDGVVVAKDQAMYTTPEDAMRFVNETNVDALAVSIGTTHGQWKSKAKINYDLLHTLKAQLGDVALVLHGGTGVSDDDMRRLAAEGMKKFNVGTELLKVWKDIAKANLEKPENTPVYSARNILVPANEKVAEVIKEKIALYRI
ncbi:class II fructose-bisphosphate aldolase [Olegusella massiliensis]|uniref:class II fructose-bisphosphate aldolase n=1 Tax=Olegusella massiliensis TaxID=1776381 RepID=UPI0040558775|nr:class II fructose-bisphosphate aldolase [Coriobacteriaceae bacterium]